MATGRILVLINRKPTPITVTKDAKHYVLQPGENHVTSDIVRYAKNQHPIPGTMHPNNPSQCEYFVGVKGTKDPVDLFDEATMELLNEVKERMNRNLLAPDRRTVQELRTAFPRSRQEVSLEAPTAGMLDLNATRGR
jgi:hypothetical protein